MLAMLNQRLLQDSFVILDFNATPTGLTDSHVSTSHITKTHLTAFSYVIRHLNPAYADLISLLPSSPHNSNLHIFANKGAPFLWRPGSTTKETCAGEYVSSKTCMQISVSLWFFPYCTNPPLSSAAWSVPKKKPWDLRDFRCSCTWLTHGFTQTFVVCWCGFVPLGACNTINKLLAAKVCNWTDQWWTGCKKKGRVIQLVTSSAFSRFLSQFLKLARTKVQIRLIPINGIIRNLLQIQSYSGSDANQYWIQSQSKVNIVKITNIFHYFS